MASPIPALSVLQSLASTIPKAILDDVSARKQLLEAAKNLILALERPDDVIERTCFQLLETATIRTAVDLGIFDLLSADGAPKTVEDVAGATKADPLLIRTARSFDITEHYHLTSWVGRVMRCLAAWGAICETGETQYTASTVSQTFADSRNVAALKTCFDLLSVAWLKLPGHLSDLNYQNPVDKLNTTLAKANGISNKSVVEIIYNSPHLQAFGTYMRTFSLGRMEWTDLYPIKERLIEGFDDSHGNVMMVDVGGGFGQQAKLLKDAFPSLAGRVVVQNLPLLSQTIPGIEFVEHDFWTEQPIKGARMYYLRLVIHDYDFDRNIVILKHLRDAMVPGYSRLLINDWIVPERGASRFMTAQDINMMSLAGIERTEKQHREQLEAAGLSISKIFRPNDTISESVIEAVLS